MKLMVPTGVILFLELGFFIIVLDIEFSTLIFEENNFDVLTLVFYGI